MDRFVLATLTALGTAALAWACSGCSMYQAIQEPANTVATIQRMQNVEKSLDHAERLMLDTPIVAGAAWLNRMDPSAAELTKYTAAWRDTPGAVPEIHMLLADVLAVHWDTLGEPPAKRKKKAEDEKKADAPAAEAPRPPGFVAENMLALISKDIDLAFREYKRAADKVARTEGAIAKLEDEAAKEGVTEEQVAALDKQIADKEAELLTLEEQATAADDKLDLALETAKVDCSKKDLLVKVLGAMTRFNKLYLEVVSVGSVMLYHFGRSVPDFDMQLMSATKGWVRASLGKQTGRVPTWDFISKLKIDMKMKGFTEPPAVSIEGIFSEDIDKEALVYDVGKSAFQFVQDFVMFPATYGFSMAMVASQRGFVASAVDMVETQCGIEAPALVELDLSATIAVDASASAATK